MKSNKEREEIDTWSHDEATTAMTTEMVELLIEAEILGWNEEDKCPYYRQTGDYLGNETED
jgi:hypothetical protein